MGTRTDITTILVRAGDGDTSAVNQLLPVVYDELRRLAARHLSQENPGHTLQATALVHEAFMRLVKQEDVAWRNRAHFFAIAAQAIRRILVDHARGRGRFKRGGGRQRVELDENLVDPGGDDGDILALHEAMEVLASLNARQAQIVELKFFGGLRFKDIAEFLGLSQRTVEGDWHMARAWLRQRLRDEGCDDPGRIRTNT